MFLTVSVIALALALRSRCTLFVLCGILSVNPAVTSVFAASMHTADACFLSMLLAACAGAVCLCACGGRRRFLCAASFLAASMALDSSTLSFALSLVLLGLIAKLLDGAPAAALLDCVAQALAALCLGVTLYAFGYLFILRRSGVTPSAAVHASAGGSFLSAWLYPLQSLFSPFTAYVRLSVLLRIALLALATGSLAARMRRFCAIRRFLLLFLFLLAPLCVNLPVFASQPTGQTSLPFVLLDVLILLLLTKAPLPRLISVRICAFAFSILFLGHAVFSNQVYLKKNLEYEATLSVMTRVLDRIEHTDGYTPGYTPVALVGTLEESTLSMAHQGFEHLAVLDAAASNYATTSYEENIWYIWEVMGYPLNFISSHEQALLEQTSTVENMPAFPEEGCCLFVGDTLVIKLS